MYRGAVRSILSELLREQRLLVVDGIRVSSPKTKELVAKLKELDLSDVLIVTEALDENLILASRNLPRVGVLSVEEVDPVSLIGFDKVLVTQGAVKVLEERLA
jgi:large subunit ribosomal protein L4